MNTDTTTAKASLEAYKQLRNNFRAWIDDYLGNHPGCKFSEARGAFILAEEEARKAIIPYEGLPCTILYDSDRKAAMVTHIYSENKVGVNSVATTCIDYYGGEYAIDNSQIDDDEPRIFTRRRNGRWIAEGQRSRDGVALALHYQAHYIAPSF